MKPPKHQDTKPGDQISQDADTGEWRISRTIPATWLIGLVSVGVIHAATTYFELRQTTSAVRDLTAEVRATSTAVHTLTAKDIEHTLQIKQIERQIYPSMPPHK